MITTFKIFENTFELKKYVIIRATNPNGYILFEITEIKGNTLIVKFLNRYYKGKIEPFDFEEMNLYLDKIKHKIVYQSDNFEDAYDNLETFVTTNKFNL